MLVVLMMETPASELAGRKAAASCTHSKAALRSHRLAPAGSIVDGLNDCDVIWCFKQGLSKDIYKVGGILCLRRFRK